MFLSPWCFCERIHVFDHFVFRARVDRAVSRDGLVSSATCSFFIVLRSSDTTEILCHFAESALFSYDVVSDDFSWPTLELFVRLNLPVSVCHRDGSLAIFEGGVRPFGHVPNDTFLHSHRMSFSTTEIHHPSSRWQLDALLASGVLNTTDGISHLLLQVAAHCCHPKCLILRGHRRGETVLLFVCSLSPLNR